MRFGHSTFIKIYLLQSIHQLGNCNMWSIKENTGFLYKAKKWYGQLGHRYLEQMEPAEGLELVILLQF